MNSPTRLVTFMKSTLLLLFAILAGCAAPAAESAAKRLNILFFTADDMSFDSSGVYGGQANDPVRGARPGKAKQANSPSTE
jgi:hypothetical protein